MRFLFRGFDRETAKAIDGHVEASDTEAAYQVLSVHGIVTETLSEDPRPPSSESPSSSPIAQFNDALESAIDACSARVPFDQLTERYRGKKVWVIDRDKIRHRVTQVVDSTLAASEANLENSTTARERVATAISGLFDDTRNIASEHDGQSIAKKRSTVAGQAANRTSAVTDGALAEQIGRLSGVVEQAESLIASMQAALRQVDTGGAPRRRVVYTGSPSLAAEQSGVLREILQSNLDLRRAIANRTT